MIIRIQNKPENGAYLNEINCTTYMKTIYSQRGYFSKETLEWKKILVDESNDSV